MSEGVGARSPGLRTAASPVAVDAGVSRAAPPSGRVIILTNTVQIGGAANPRGADEERHASA